ncbi:MULTISPECIES: hypothetical protein [unclassified Haloarcula]|uniref:hypothetical protein n=1 Tax=unclassified Haloarcula TaxID=2624677 RepID=UPI000EF20B9E|nr:MULTISPECIES: hypothetical protein [unclassified Haloarcula]RLM33501.1 hypothetical protein DVK01_17745 [Haloarcula sp. Atlit-120R]RLM42098.1 hypothetical protein DVK00_16990 [Haloarcula sp. Atlit-47R]
MPSENQAGDRRERLRCPRLVEDIGEDPARWLDQDLLSHPDRRKLVFSLIDGIDSIERIRAWRGTERKLASDRVAEKARNPLEKPRAKIMQRLEQREKWLELHGERPDRLPCGPRRPCDCCDGESEVTPEDLRERDEAAAQRLVESYQADGVDTSETSPETEASTLGAFATDGGEPQ